MKMSFMGGKMHTTVVFDAYAQALRDQMTAAFSLKGLLTVGLHLAAQKSPDEIFRLMSVIRDLKESDAQYPPEARIGSSALREAKIIVHTAQSRYDVLGPEDRKLLAELRDMLRPPLTRKAGSG